MVLNIIIYNSYQIKGFFNKNCCLLNLKHNMDYSTVFTRFRVALFLKSFIHYS